MPRTSIKESFSTVPRETDGKPRIIRRNTFSYRKPDGTEVIRLHLTDIAERKGATITLNSGDYKTVTTKDRINVALSLWGTAYSVYSDRGLWYVRKGPWPDGLDGVADYKAWRADNSVPFYDGMKLPDAFLSDDWQGFNAEKEGRELKAKIAAFVNKTIPLKGPIPLPDSGDCFFCSMFDAEPKASRESNGHTVHKPIAERNSDHIREHIREGYMNGSLIRNAFRFAGYRDEGITLWLGSIRDFKHIRRVTKRYLNRRLGLAA